MDGRLNNSSEDPEFKLDIRNSSSVSRVVKDERMIQTSSPKRSKRAVQKRVVSVPIGDAEGSRLKGEAAPPSDSWAWRKYGQKPIKGSPYPRGYYRCSSSKGCPARKQVERSRVDPTMLVITYACEHNHTWPATKISNPTTTTSPTRSESPPIEPTRPKLEPKPEIKHESQYSDLVDDSLINSDEYTWFADVESTSLTVFDSPIYAGSGSNDADVAMIFQMREEDESLFADLGELPECSVVFRRGFIEKEEQLQRCNFKDFIV